MTGNKNRVLAFLLSPVFLLLLIFFILPVGYLILYSFQRYDPATLVEPIFTMENYKEFFSDPYILSALFRTLRIAAITTLVTLIIGYPLSYYMRLAGGREKTIFSIVVLTPLMTSHIILGFAWMALLAPQTGLASVSLQALGLISEPLRLMGTEVGVVIGLVHYTLVYMVLNLHSSLETIDLMQIKAASMLGANPFQTFLRVTLPLSLPGILSGVSLAFAVSASQFMIPLLIAGRQAPMLPVLVFDLNATVLNWPMGASTALILLFISLIPIFILSTVVNTQLTKRHLS